MSGKSTSNQQSASSSAVKPYEPTIPLINDILGQIKPQIGNTGITGAETDALGGLLSNAGNFASLGADLLGGGTDRTGMVQGAYDELRAGLTPYTTMDTNPYSNEAFQKATSFLTDDIENRIKSAYAGAGYSPVRSGDYAKTLGEGVARGVAPTWLQAYNDNEARKMGAITGLYDAGNTSAGVLSGLDQLSLNNKLTGLDLADQPYKRALEVEAMRRGIPLSNLAQIESLVVPMAQLGQQTTSQGQVTGSQTMSPAQQAWGWMNSFANLNRSWGPQR
jgi:hypothetical protein